MSETLQLVKRALPSAYCVQFFPLQEVKRARKQTYQGKGQSSVILTSSSVEKTVLEKEELSGKRKKKTGGKTNQEKAKTRKASENEDACIYCTEGTRCTCI